MIVADSLWISRSKQAGQSATELNSIRLKDSLLQLLQLTITLKYAGQVVFVNYDVFGLKCA